jgi:tetratricopeptide (TPR) repeat protein
MSESREVAARAEAALRAGDTGTARALAAAALRERPQDRGLLRVAARAAADFDPDEATRLFRALAEADPDDAESWRELGLAAAESGQVEQAAEAFQRAVVLQPADVDSLVHLANVSFMLGRVDEAVELLHRSVDLHPDEPSLLANLLDVMTAAGRTQAARDVARRLVSLDPENVSAALTEAELCLSMGDNRSALRAFTRLRSIDDNDGHALYAAHGQVTALLMDEQWRTALDAAINATRLDRHQLTTDLLSYVATRLFGEGSYPPVSWEELEAALAAERTEHRRLHDEERAA